MPIERNWPITFDQDHFLALHGEAYTRMLTRPAMRRIWDDTFAEAARLVAPAAVWEAHPIRELRHEKVFLQNGARIGNGPVTSVVGGASDLIVAVCTAGPGFSRQAAEYQRTGEPLRALLLGDLGTYAVSALVQQLCRRLETDAAARGLYTTTHLSPGESEWSLADQKVIFSLVDAAAIGVSLTESLLMAPVKSVSLIMGLGDHPIGIPGATHCDYCTMAERCIYRQAGAASEGLSGPR